MKFFINIIMIGVALILTTYLNDKFKEPVVKRKLFNITLIDEFIYYMEIEVLSNIKYSYGIVMTTCGILGLLFYNSLGIYILFITLLFMCYYFLNLFRNAYRYIKNY